MRIPLTIQAETPYEAYGMSMLRLLNNGMQFGFNIHIKQSCMYDENWMKQLDTQRIKKDYPSIFDSADVIFPKWKNHYDKKRLKPWLEEQIAYYNDAPFRPVWGTYFERNTDSKWEGRNAILDTIKALKSWGKDTRSVFCFHITSIDHDKTQPQGNPCLQYLELIRTEKNELSICFTYRAQDFFGKALGNWIGISRMLEFICYNTGFKPGGLIGLSGRAYLSGTKNDQEKMLKKLGLGSVPHGQK